MKLKNYLNEENMEFKIGDVVAVYSRGRLIKTSKIEKITPKGAIKVDGDLYTPDGHQKGGDTWGRKTIMLIDDNIRDQITRIKFKNTIRKFADDVQVGKTDKIPIEDLKRVVSAIHELGNYNE
jgi:hypothetical protein